MFRPPSGQQINPMLGQMGALGGMGMGMGMQSGMMGQMGMQLGPGMLPLNAAAFGQQQQQQGGAPPKSRAFIGIVTKLQDNYGFVDDDVFFQTNVVKGPLPRANEKVMVEAQFNANMPFKWNATRVQVLPNQDDRSKPSVTGAAARGGAPAGNDYRRGGGERDRSPRGRRERSPPRSSRISTENRSSAPKRERERSRDHDRESASRTREDTRSPARRRQRVNVSQRYELFIARTAGALISRNFVDTVLLRRCYKDLYVPSDFFHSEVAISEVFPLHKSFSLDHACQYHIMNKDVDPLVENRAVFDPPDVDYAYSAKVMLLSIPSMLDTYKKVLGMKDDVALDLDSCEPQHINRVLSFLVGSKQGKNELMAIGGPWSQALDGADPENDPRVLIKTAIRTTLALTGLDLSRCTQWFKLSEVHYRRGEQSGGTVDVDMSSSAASPDSSAPRVETVVFYLPDVWNLMPSATEFEKTVEQLNGVLTSKLEAIDLEAQEAEAAEAEADQAAAAAAAEPAEEIATNGEAEESKEPEANTAEEKAEESSEKPEEATEAVEEEESDEKPTHYSKIDLKQLKVADLRQELDARGIDSKGIKSQLVQKLQAALEEEKKKDEEAKGSGDVEMTEAPKEGEGAEEKKEDAGETKEKEGEAKESETADEVQIVEPEKPKKSEEEIKREKEREEREKQRKKEKDEADRKARKGKLERHYTLPANPPPGLLIHPCKTAKSGRFECKIVSLQQLLHYRQENNKEHSFEVALFAEMFNELMSRDFAFQIYKSLVAQSELEDELKAAAEAAKATESTEDLEEAVAAGDLEVKDEVKEDTEADQAVKQEGKKEAVETVVVKAEEKKKEVKVESLSGVIEVKKPLLLLAYSYFDTNQCGYVVDRDVESIVNTLGLHLSRAQTSRLTRKVAQREKFEYRALAAVPKAKEGEEAAVLREPSNMPSDDVLCAGNKSLVRRAQNEKEGGSSVRSVIPELGDNSTVKFRGAVVDVASVIDQLQRIEQQSKFSEAMNNQLTTELKAAKENVDSLDRKRKRLDEDVKSYRKRLHDTSGDLKTSQRETRDLKDYLKRVKEHANDVVRIVERAIPPPPKKEEKKETKDEKKEEEAGADTPAVAAVAEGAAEADGEEGADIPDDLAVSDEVVENDKPEADMQI